MAKNNFLLTLLKLCGFIIIAFFLAALSKEFTLSLKKSHLLPLIKIAEGGILYLLFHIFIADLTGIYGKIQEFFFRKTFVNLLIPSLLVIVSVIYWSLPKFSAAHLNANLYFYLSGFLFLLHLVFISLHTKEKGFGGFVEYVFIFSLLYVLNLIIFAFCLKAVINIHPFHIIAESARKSYLYFNHFLAKVTS